ncbi:MAG: hypothetical protein HYY96_10890 [Candidatus Tectomicrobia bacterium]|nr:hypothetical protein [Candidatus Tectomicrobia bacterium]
MAEKAFDPEDPMELVGVELPGCDPAQMLDDIVQEYLLMGWGAAQILELFRSPHFTATHRILQLMGEPYVTERVDRLAEAWQQGWLTEGEADG